jgi:two-component system sporulation sensor kinase A
LNYLTLGKNARPVKGGAELHQPDIAGINLINDTLIEYKNLRLLADNIQDIVIIVDNKGRIKYVSPAYRNLVGLDPTNIIGNCIADSGHLHPEDYDRVAAVVQKGVVTAKPDMTQFRYRNVDGNYFWMEATSNPLFDEDGSFIGAVCISRDISSRKCIENALAESEARCREKVHYLNTLIDNMNEIFFTYDKEGRLTLANQKCLKMFGYKWEEAAGKQLVDFVTEASKSRITDGIKTRLTMGTSDSYEFNILTKYGRERLFSANVSPVIENLEITGGIVVAEDITDRRQVEKELQKQLCFLQKLMDSMPNPVYFKDTRGLYQGCNPP